MKVTLETRCKESQAHNWILAGLRRRFTTQEQFENQIEVLCLDVASELGLNFEYTQLGVLLFKDKDLK
jgi:hypothetical protein